MRIAMTGCLTVFLAGTPLVLQAQELRNVPLRINMGGAATVDSYGRTWLGDGPGAGDPLGIRPDDQSGTNWIENWSTGVFQGDSLDALGFDSTHPGDIYIFNTIRWDTGGDGIDFRLALPVPEGEYTVNFYFNEGCCTNRHFKIEIEGEIVDEDVSYLDYDPANPAIGRVGRLSFEDIGVGPDKLLDIGLLPCPVADCPEGGDINAIINAIEVISGPNCDHLGLDLNGVYQAGPDAVELTWNGIAGADGFRIRKNGAPLAGPLPSTARSFTDPAPRSGGQMPAYVLEALDGDTVMGQCRANVNAFACPDGLACVVDNDAREVALSWSPAGGINVTGIEVRRNGALLQTLPANASSFEDTPNARFVDYTVTAVTNPADQCTPISCSVTVESAPFALPLRIAMGNVDTVDSRGRLWIGDGTGAGDILGIRPDDASGTNTIQNWCAVDADSFRKFGLNAADPGDRSIFGSIRWDVGNDGIDFYVELPVPNANDYFVNLYFNECCCPARHFKIEINGEVVDEDVSSADYDAAPGFGKLGRLTFKDVVVDNEVLRIGFLPCPDCPGVADTNAIVNAIEVIRNPCSEVGFRECPSNLTCDLPVPFTKRVTGTWDAPLCFTPTGYEVRRNGTVVATLPGEALSFVDTLPTRVGFYEVQALVPEGADPCPALACTVVNEDVAFEIPLRLNMGGNTLSDSRGQLWIGDGGGTGDLLGIRLDDAGGTNTAPNWCVAASNANADTLASLGFNAANPNDQAIFNTIRWDLGDDDGDTFSGEEADPDGGDTDFRLEIPIPNGNYLVNSYFTECCCPNRHFKIEIEGNLEDDDVSSADYSEVPNLGRTGRLSFDNIAVTDGNLSIGFLPCPECPDATDTNAIIDAIEVLPAGSTVRTCPRDLICDVDGNGNVTGTWSGPQNVTLSGYDVFRGADKIDTLPASATSFSDSNPPCERRLEYRVAPLSADPQFLCPGLMMSCAVLQPECPFGAPLRINMGGVEVLDSHGDRWLGDGPGTGDPLEIRVDDASGTNTIENWCAPDATSIDALGFDGTHPSDRYILSTIRWDVGNDGIDFQLEIPIVDGTYSINLYFNECCCAGRHFKIEIQGEIVDEDVSYLDYDTAAPALGKVGRLTFEGIEVGDGLLHIGFLPCPDCPGASDTNAIVNGIEILPGGSTTPQFHRGDADDNGQLQLTDAIRILGFLFLGGPAPTCLEAADADDNGSLQLTDAIRVLGYLFLGGVPPAPPGPPPSACGSDPAGSPDVGCESYTSC